MSSGSTRVGSSSITLNSASADIWGNADAFTFVYRPWNGNGEIVTRVDGVTNSNGWAKAGVMFRETLAAGSAHAFVMVTPSVGVSFQARAAANGSTAGANHTWGPAAPWWMKLVRDGNTFAAFDSPDGVSWRSQGSQTIAVAADIHVGFAAISQNAGVSRRRRSVSL